MKRIIKLTERDLTRIVKRILSEDDIRPTNPANVASTTSVDKLPTYGGPNPNDLLSTKLNKDAVKYYISCEDLVALETSVSETQELKDALKKGGIKAYSFSKKDSFDGGIKQDDPYNYIILNNSKYCFHHSNDDSSWKWKEISDPKVKSKVDKTMEKRKTY